MDSASYGTGGQLFKPTTSHGTSSTQAADDAYTYGMLFLTIKSSCETLEIHGGQHCTKMPVQSNTAIIPGRTSPGRVASTWQSLSATDSSPCTRNLYPVYPTPCRPRLNSTRDSSRLSVDTNSSIYNGRLIKDSPGTRQCVIQSRHLHEKSRSPSNRFNASSRQRQGRGADEQSEQEMDIEDDGASLNNRQCYFLSDMILPLQYVKVVFSIPKVKKELCRGGYWFD